MSLRNTALIFLHGSGGSGPELRSFLDCVPLERHGYQTFRELSSSLQISYFTPTSSNSPYTGAFDIRSRNWHEVGRDDPVEDVTGIEFSIANVTAVLEELKTDFRNIIIGGHSMGGGLSLQLLRKQLPDIVKGIFSIGSFCTKSSILLNNDTGNTLNSKIPVLMMHGTHDDLIPVQWGRDTATDLLLKGVDVEFRTYAGHAHNLSEIYLVELLDWVGGIVASQPAPIDELPASLAPSLETLNLHQSDTDESNLQYEHKELGDGRHRVIYPVPNDMIPLLVSRPILACGAAFELTSSPQGVETVFVSADPHATAREIGKRLKNRISSNGGSLNACPMS